ncbi:FecCD family ABC transporter permease [Treponema pedis]|uniref:FecCD family ABC transporter permease n=1 Tax=Treponema pedis TaxID=409322 RepID=UPI000406FB6C|nr:iron ABC transporter permease [Treponema pedis]
MNKNNKDRVLKAVFISSALLFLLGLLFVSIVLSIGFGAVRIVPKDILQIVQFKIFGTGTLTSVKKSAIDIVWVIRLPRIILACLTGMGLALTGVIMQAVVKNSLADPYILGISSGASLGATLAIALGIGSGLGPNYVGLCACFSAFAASLIVMKAANINGRANSVKLLMAGIAVSTIFSAFSSFIVFTAKNREAMRSISFWLMGGFGGAKWENLGLLSSIILAGVFFFMTQYRTLNLMLLGDSVSITLGKDLHYYRQVYLLLSSIIVGFLVYNAGIIGFVGLIVPHIARIFWGTNHKNIIPASVLIGAVILIWADVLARSISSLGEIPVGAVISLIGAPVFLYLLINKEYGFGGRT